MLVHDQLRQRRKAFGLQQGDMKLRIGMNQQQYQRVEANGNPRLETLKQIAEGLDSEVVLVPKEKLAAVLGLLEGDASAPSAHTAATERLDVDPWIGILGTSHSAA